VDDHADPVAELRRIYDLVVQHSLRIEREYGPDGLRLFSRVKYSPGSDEAASPFFE
jgi:hypothetical protein